MDEEKVHVLMSDRVDDLYLNVCKYLLEAPKVSTTRELNNVKLELGDITNNIVNIRNISPSYLFAEWLWYFTGRNDVAFIGTFASLWKKLSDDGETCNSAYGYLMQEAFGFNQVEKIIELLHYDPNSRRAVINLNTPNKHVIETKDEPCTIALQFLIRNGELHCTTMMRSNDIWFGFPYDIAFFTELQIYIADRLNVKYGTYTHFVVSMHLYDKDYDAVKKIVENPIVKKIRFDRKKFHKNKYFASRLISYTISNENNRSAMKDLILDLAKEYFDYKQED